MIRTKLALCNVIGIPAVLLLLAGPALSQRPRVPTTYTGNLAAASKVSEEEVDKVLKALAPIIREGLAAGQTMDIEGLGQFRVVRVAGHKDMVNGRPTTIPAANAVEFLPVGDLVEAA